MLLFTTAQKGWRLDGWGWRLLTHAIVEAAKALRGSFKLVTLAPKTVREMTQLLRETQTNGRHTDKSKSTNEHTKHKPRLNTHKKHWPN